MWKAETTAAAAAKTTPTELTLRHHQERDKIRQAEPKSGAQVVFEATSIIKALNLRQKALQADADERRQKTVQSSLTDCPMLAHNATSL